MTSLFIRNLLAYSAQITILIGVAAVLATLLKLTAAARLRSFQLLLAVCIAAPLVQPWRVPPPEKDTITVTSILISSGVPTGAGPGRWSPSTAEMIAAVIAAGILVRLGLIGMGMLRLSRYRDQARFVPTAFPIEKERTRAWPDVFISKELKGPVTFGLFRPAILVPERWMGNETVAYHELLHVRRRDWAFAIIEEFIRALLWFHPAVWWLIGHIQLAREEMVDREVVRLMESREQYLETLLAIAEAKAGLDLAPAPLFLKKRHLRQRVAALLKEVTMSKNRTRSLLAGWAAALAIAGWIAIHSFPLQAAPQSVRDAPGVTVQQDESKLQHRAGIRYPEEALQKGVQGTVLIDATLDQNGEVSDAQVISGPPELRKAVLESVLQWHYNKDSGLPPRVQVAIDFALPRNGPGAPSPRVELSAPPPPLPPPTTGTIKQIDLYGVPESLRSKLAGRLPIHIGDQYSAASLPDLKAALREVDDHLHAGLMFAPDGGLTIRIYLDGSANSTYMMAPPQRIRVGNNVVTANLITKVQPVYPLLAKQARVQGTVRFTVVIGKDGQVGDIQLLSGHPLLVQAAQDAVKQWVYKPTLLNGERVEVATQIDVNFTLSEDIPPPPGRP